MAAYNQLIPPSFPVASVDALADLATEVHAALALYRGGPAQRTARLLECGVELSEAAGMAAKQGKGHIAEVQQAANFTTRAGALGSDVRARPNRRANDPLNDIELFGPRRRKRGVQVKVGSPRYVRQAIRSGRYGDLIVNKEAYDRLPSGLARQVDDHLQHDGVAARSLSGDDAEATASDQLQRLFAGELPVSDLDILAHSIGAGARDGLSSFALGMLGRLASSIINGEVFDIRGEAAALLQGSIRAAARTCIEAGILMKRFTAQARDAFSAKLLHKLAGSRLVVSAVAEIILETALDVVEVLKERMSFEQLLRRFGVHCCKAVGSAAGVAVALQLTRGEPLWVTAIAVLALGYVGARAGSEFGEVLFNAHQGVSMEAALP